MFELSFTWVQGACFKKMRLPSSYWIFASPPVSYPHPLLALPIPTLPKFHSVTTPPRTLSSLPSTNEPHAASLHLILSSPPYTSHPTLHSSHPLLTQLSIHHPLESKVDIPSLCCIFAVVRPSCEHLIHAPRLWLR